MKQPGKHSFICTLSLLFFAGMAVTTPAADDPLAWPALTFQTRPWTYWWWMGSAVDKTNLTRELQRYHDAGLGGVHIVPIYGAKGWESNYIGYLSPKWMEMLGYTVSEAHRLGLGVDMTTGTGWCFGGPQVSDQDANAHVVVKTYDLGAGERLKEKFKRESIQALVAFGPDGKSIDLTDSISTNGEVFFSPPGNRVGTETSAPPKTWRIYAISQKPSGQKVKRAAPGGAGWMLNPFYPPAMSDYLRRFTEALARDDGPKPRAMFPIKGAQLLMAKSGCNRPKPRAQYQDSYEYQSDWSPDFFAQFEKRRGYMLQTELPALFGTNQDDHAARVKSDYCETISDILVEETEPLWIKWSHEHGFITRYEAHGAPGNLLDLYALADIPETEVFRTNRNLLVSKFASSAAHVTGKPLVSAETGTWLAEHFTETLGEMKSLVDEMFLSGVNHVFYHGTCYSPDEAGWPGWLFYASTEMNPRNSIWRDAPALNAYVTRCQSILQSGKPDNDVLLYWPIYDFWNDPAGRLVQLQVETQQIWFENQPIGKTAQELWNRGVAFDYVSDAQLKNASITASRRIHMPGGEYGSIIVPECKYIPLKTFRQLLALAEKGAHIYFINDLPKDIPGAKDVAARRIEFNQLKSKIIFQQTFEDPTEVRDRRIFTKIADFGKGRVECTDYWFPFSCFGTAGNTGLSYIRRSYSGNWKGWNYFVVNRTKTNFDGCVCLDEDDGGSVVIFDPMTGKSGLAERKTEGIHLQLAAGESLILRTFRAQDYETVAKEIEGSAWTYWQTNGPPVEIIGTWQVKFIQGGPTLPADFQTTKLASWTTFPDTNTQAFAGTAKYEINFDAPRRGELHESQNEKSKSGARGARPSENYYLDLGDVRQSARVKLNGRDYGTLITPPFRVVVDNLKPKDNVLEIEVTGVTANRIRDLDRRGVPWKNFHDINFVNIDYKPFSAADSPLTESGLLGPVTLTALVPAQTNFPPRVIAPGPFQPTWESLASQYRCPAWFRDAKFGIWAHWSAQCVPEQGDWYARKMYIQGEPDYEYHVAHYGHPSQFGFMEIDNLWHAEHWEPKKLMALYRAAGAKYFVALANHHDNFDCYDSKYHAWNSVNVGPHRDIVGTWAKIARKNGLRFGVSNHSAHSWHWFQTAYGYDGEGPLAGVRYDAFTLTKADGKGKWWDGLDPQELYTGPNLVMPDGITNIQAALKWHNQNDRRWTENPPTNNPAFVQSWFLRCQDLVDKYHPDLLYFDDNELPLGQAGLDMVADYYNADWGWNNGKLEAVATGKHLTPGHRAALVEDYERGFADGIQPLPWQTDTCIGQWHYSREVYEKHQYKTTGQVLRLLVDIVSKNGNLLLSIPVRGDGTIDSDEIAFLQGMAQWMKVNGEGIFGSRPWKIYGEGSVQAQGGMFNENKVKFGAGDIRFTTKNGALYAYFLGWPDDGKLVIQSLGQGAADKPALLDQTIASVTLLGSSKKIAWTREADGLHVTLPAKKPCDDVFTLKLVLK